MLPRIYLARHGQTEWSLTGRHTGRTDAVLTTDGESEARSVGQRLRGMMFDHVVSSPRLRATRTCALAGITDTPLIDDDFREWDYGDYEGLRSAEITALHSGWNVFLHGCPGGESPDQISERADRAVRTLQALPGNILVFSHGHFLRVLAVRWVGLSIAAAQRIYLNTGSLSMLGYEHERREEPVILLWNERPPQSPQSCD
ncbi:MAG: histidine phosphatase family protein [Opitutus sp.]